jgi:hypothetical protein
VTADLPDTIPDDPCAWHYSADGQTLLRADPLTTDELGWLPRANQVGAGSVVMSLADANADPAIGDRHVIKFSLYGQIRDGIVVRQEECELAINGDDNQQLVMNTQPSVAVLLNSGVVYPEFGLERASDPDRVFGWMSRSDIGGWYTSGDWTEPNEVVYNETDGAHQAFPPEFRTIDPDAYWLALGDPDDPDHDNPDDETTYFRSDTITIDTAIDAMVYVSLDNIGEVWHNGQKIGEQGDWVNPRAWHNALGIPIRLDVGDHEFAVKVTNFPRLSGSVGPNPTAFLFTLFGVNSQGTRVGDILLRSRAANWLVYSGDSVPGWRPAQVLRQAIVEMQDANCLDLVPFTLTFTDTEDSNSEAHGGTILTDFAVPIGKLGLADLAWQLCSSGIDVWVDAATWTINAYNRKGTDLRASVELKLGDATPPGTLLSWRTTRTTRQATTGLIQMGDGTWLLVEDSAAVTALGGKVFTGIDIGQTTSRDTATALGQQVITETATPLETVAVEYAPEESPKLYVDCDLFDTIAGPGHRGVGTSAWRIMSGGVDATGDLTDTSIADLVKDGS